MHFINPDRNVTGYLSDITTQKSEHTCRSLAPKWGAWGSGGVKLQDSGQKYVLAILNVNYSLDSLAICKEN